jgi:predicted RNA-binding protein
VEKIAIGDRFVLYVAQISRFAAITEVIGKMYEDTEKIWSSASTSDEVYPIRLSIKRVIVLPDNVLLDVRLLVPQLSFIPEGLKPAKYGAAFRVLRAIPEPDYKLVESRMQEVLASYEAESTEKFVVKKRLLGPTLNFRALQHAPINEQGVVYLFGMVARN